MDNKVGIIKQTNSIFQQPWWLDAVAHDKWNSVEINRNGQTIARLPFIVNKKRGMTMLNMPILTQTLGIWLSPSSAKYSKQLAQQKDLISLLIEQLPHYDYFCQNFHYSITNWLPFYWHGFSQTSFYTYVIENLSNLDLVWHEFQQKIRTDIRKAQKKVIIRTDLDIDRFLDINALTFNRQGRNLPYSRDLVKRIDTACVRHNARKIFFAEDEKNHIHAAIYIIWDENSAYYLMGGGDPELRNSGATSLLMWEAIQFAATVTKKFDFEGSMIESVERFFRGFGARQIPYFQISRMSRRMQLLTTGKKMIKCLIGK